MKQYFLTLSLCLAGFSFSFAQGVETLWSPELSFTWKYSNRWTFNGKANPRLFLYNNQNESYIPTDPLMERSEFQLLASYALFSNSSIGGGYLLGLRTMPDTSVINTEHKIMAQYTFSFFLGAARIGNRPRIAYRYFTRDVNEVRLSYKLSYDIPLNGRQVNPKEAYFVVSNEFLGAFAQKSFSPENRFYAAIGWQLSSKNKLELGAEYRADDYFGDTAHVLLFVTSLYFNK